MSEPGWDGPDTPRAHTRQATRTSEEERVLTDFARNYLSGRRMLCRMSHVCAAVGGTVAAVVVTWDHLMTAALAARRLLLGH